MKTARFKSILLLAGLALGLCARARADLAFALAASTQSGAGSNEIFFTASLTNTSLTDNLFLNDIQFVFDGAGTNYLTASTNVFFRNVPGILLPGEVYSDIVFSVALNPTIPPGDYTGTATLLGGADIFATNSLTSQAFDISLPPATLAIVQVATNLVVSWISPPGSFALQANNDLTTTNWSAVTNAPAATNGLNQVLFCLPTNNLFFRLVYP